MMLFTRIAMLIALIVNGVACSPVSPWQRGVLAKPQMALDPNPIDEVMRNHNYSSREAAPAGGAGVGGGCGCY